MEEDDVICDDGAQIDCAPTFRSHGPIRYTTCNIDSFAFLQIIVDSVSQFRPKNSDSMPLRFLGDLTCKRKIIFYTNATFCIRCNF